MIRKKYGAYDIVGEPERVVEERSWSRRLRDWYAYYQGSIKINGIEEYFEISIKDTLVWHEDIYRIHYLDGTVREFLPECGRMSGEGGE